MSNTPTGAERFHFKGPNLEVWKYPANRRITAAYNAGVADERKRIAANLRGFVADFEATLSEHFYGGEDEFRAHLDELHGDLQAIVEQEVEG